MRNTITTNATTHRKPMPNTLQHDADANTHMQNAQAYTYASVGCASRSKASSVEQVESEYLCTYPVRGPSWVEVVPCGVCHSRAGRVPSRSLAGGLCQARLPLEPSPQGRAGAWSWSHSLPPAGDELGVPVHSGFKFEGNIASSRSQASKGKASVPTQVF